MASSDKDQFLQIVREAVAALQTASVALDAAVRTALDNGATWLEIGDLLGVSRQAAFYRFGPKKPREEPSDSGQLAGTAAVVEDLDLDLGFDAGVDLGL